MKLLHVEIIASIGIAFLMSAVGFLFSHSILISYENAKTNYAIKSVLYDQKKSAEKQNVLIVQNLKQWKEKNSGLYQFAESPLTDDQVMDLLTRAILQSHFAVVKVESFCFVLSGQYFNLFALLDRLNALSLPVTISTLKIENEHSFIIQFSLKQKIA